MARISEESGTTIYSQPTIKDGRPKAKGARKARARRDLWTILSLQALPLNGVALLAVATVALLHLGALTLFTKGFLLSRTTLEKRNTCSRPPSGSGKLEDGCTLPPKFDRAVILLIDALRWDFIFPIDRGNTKYDAFHHNHLTVPAQLAKELPEHSLLFKGIADPPTATLQRLKAITTGSLPTFVDMGSNFAGSAVEEDNWLEQAKRAGKRIAFMGDDTWLTIFPESIFAPNSSFPFDSFNVEDLDTVDEGVARHVLPFLQQDSGTSTWDILIAHPLGLDHAGHRFGASHAETRRKLRDMNSLIEKMVSGLGERDLFIVLGDHGMDAKGDHGGDSPDETEAGLWIYSKTRLVPKDYMRQPVFPGTAGTAKPSTFTQLLDPTADTFDLDGQQYRVVNQISLIPSLSLLLGLPIPFNNLGTIIPELFLQAQPKSWSGRTSAQYAANLVSAMAINARQVLSYLEEYDSTSSGSDLAPYVPGLAQLHADASAQTDPQAAFLLQRRFMDETLAATRSIWAQFDPVSMGAGLLVLLGSLVAIYRLWSSSQIEGSLWRAGPTRQALSRGLIGAILGFGLGLVVCAAQVIFRLSVLPGTRVVISTTCLAAEIGIASFRLPPVEAPLAQASVTARASTLISGFLLLVHFVSFASNSFIMWEDLIVLAMVQVPVVHLLIQALTAPEARLRWRIAGYSILTLICNRLVGISTICREEQHPYCTATFYGSSGTSVPSASATRAALLAALILPAVIARFLNISKANQAWTPYLLKYSFRAILAGGSLYWMADHLEHTANTEFPLPLATFKVTLARTLLMCSVLLVTTLWYSSPLSIQVLQKEVTDPSGKKTTQVSVIGFANAVASSYLLLFLGFFGVIFLLTQSVGQIVLAFGLVGLLSLLEAADSARDAALLRQRLESPTGQQPAVSELMGQTSTLAVFFLVLLGHHLFFATGHQAVLSAIQWKVAFVGFPTLTYPFSPILVILNTLGPFMLAAAALPLLVFWNVPPTLKNGPTIPLLSRLLQASLAFIFYHTALTLSSAIFSAHLRRHLMVWKVFAPRFMLSAMTLLAVDVTILVVALGWGGLGVLRKLQTTFGTAWS